MSWNTRVIWGFGFLALGACGAKTSDETAATQPDAFPGGDPLVDDVATPEEQPSDNDEDQVQPPPEPQSGRLQDSTGLEFTWQCDEQQQCSLTTQAEDSCGGHSFGGPYAGLAPNVPLICDACGLPRMAHFLVLDMQYGDTCRPLSCESDSDCMRGPDSSDKCVNSICHVAEANAEDYTPHEVWVLCVAAAARGEYAELESLRQTLLETCPETFQCYADCGWDLACSMPCRPDESARCPLPESCR